MICSRGCQTPQLHLQPVELAGSGSHRSSLASSPPASTMFNAPRTSPSAQRYNPSNSILGGFVDDNPLAASVFDDGGLDPWSGIPSTPALPARAPLPSLNLGSSGNDNLGVFANILGT